MQKKNNVTSYVRIQPEYSWLFQILQSFINPNGRVLQQQVAPRLSRANGMEARGKEQERWGEISVE
jgi:hypothetical protein